MKDSPDRNGAMVKEMPKPVDLNLEDVEEISYILDRSNLEEQRDELGSTGQLNVSKSPIICKSPMPITLDFECSSDSLSHEILQRKTAQVKRRQFFTPKENVKRIKILHSINNVTHGECFFHDGTPLNLAQKKVRRNLMDHYGDIESANFEEEKSIIEPETTQQFLNRDFSELAIHVDSEILYKPDESLIFQKLVFNTKLSAKMPVFRNGRIHFIDEISAFEPTLRLATLAMAQENDVFWPIEHRLEVSNQLLIKPLIN